MRVLVACECSGTVRDAFRRRGHDAWSADLLPSMRPGPHVQGDVRAILSEGWDLLIAHPPCTYLAVSGLHWNGRRPGRAVRSAEALAFVEQLLEAPVPRIALENPVGLIGSCIRPPDQTIQPYEFGDDASKRTCLWLKGLEPLRPTAFVAPRMVDGRPRWRNQTDSGQNRESPGPERARRRSVTYPGIAEAMAEQWGAPTWRQASLVLEAYA